MALIPGATINGKFKTFNKMTTEELEKVVYKEQFKRMIVTLLSAIFCVMVLLTISL